MENKPIEELNQATITSQTKQEKPTNRINNTIQQDTEVLDEDEELDEIEKDDAYDEQ